MSRIIHVCIPIDVALRELAKGESPLTGNVHDQMRALCKARREGKTFFSGDECTNQTPEGRCAGHEVAREESPCVSQ